MILHTKLPAILAFMSVCGLTAVVWAQASSAQANVATGFTQPSERRTLAFESAGVVAEVLVKEGDAVKAGQTLMRQDDRMDRQELEVRRIDAESTVEIESARKEFELRKVQYERKASAPVGTGFSAAEVEESLIAMQLSELKIAEAQQKNAQAKAVYERQRVKTEVMQLVSKIEGVVEKINVDAGEMADPQKPEGAISVVRNDPLWVEMPLLSSWQAAKLRKGQELEVQYVNALGEGVGEWRKAKVIFVAPVADARSGTQSVRLELPNPDNASAGLDVQVKLPPELAGGN